MLDIQSQSQLADALQELPAALQARIEIELPSKFREWFVPKRFKIAHGGRNGTKSTSIGIMLILLGSIRKLRILCAREVQKSIEQSVYLLLKGVIERYKLTNYQVLRDRITASNGTEIMFRGLAAETIDSVRSLDGVDICWVEEGAAVRERSWNILIPTIRKPGSEIWVSYNPELETDYVHKHLTKSGRPDVMVTEINITDNPWASQEMWTEFAIASSKDPVMFAHTWLGQCLPAVIGAIYAKQLSHAEHDHRITRVPYDPSAATLISFDIGYSDYTSMVCGHHVGLERRIFHAYEHHLEETSHYIDHIKTHKWRVDHIELPHDAYAKRINAGAGKTVYDEFRKAFPNARIKTAEEVHRNAVSVVQGIQHARKMMAYTYIDKDCEVLIEALRRYRWHINATGQQTTPVHDEYSHMADAWRYWHLHDNIGSRLRANPNNESRDRRDRTLLKPY